MSTTLTKAEPDPFMAATVRHPNGHRHVLLEGLSASATVPELRARAMAALHLPNDVDWTIREDRTGRLARDEQTLSDLVDEQSPRAELTMQPDATLG